MVNVEKGDHVRVVLEGRASEVFNKGYPSGEHFGFLADDEPASAPWIFPSSPLVKSVEKIEPPVEVFKPGDRLKYKGGVSSEITVGENGYLQHYEDGQVIWYKSDQEFTSEDYERVYPGAGE